MRTVSVVFVTKICFARKMLVLVRELSFLQPELEPVGLSGYRTFVLLSTFIKGWQVLNRYELKPAFFMSNILDNRM